MPQACTDAVMEENLRIGHEGGHLQGQLAYTPDAGFCDGVLLVPPHPNFAGTMDNNVIEAVYRHFSATGSAVLRFNYPGIGESTPPADCHGSAFDYWRRLEDDRNFDCALRALRGALSYLQNSLQPFLNRIHVIGYSYGGLIAMLLASESPCCGSTVAVAMPWIGRYDYAALYPAAGARIFVQGKDDFACDDAVLASVWPKLQGRPLRITVDGDHFFRGRESCLARGVESAIRNHKIRNVS